MKKPSISIIFLTVLIDLVGFGLILPLHPDLQRQFPRQRLDDRGDHRLLFLDAIYLLAHLGAAFGPDRAASRFAGQHGVRLSVVRDFCRRLRAVGQHRAAGDFLASRLFAGICGANITVAQAYIADITPPEKRSARMGLIGMAFGLGFILGPVLGGLSTKYFGPTAPGWTAAALCALNFIWAFVSLAESWQPADPRRHPTAARRTMAAYYAHAAAQFAHRHLFPGDLLFHLL